MRLQAESGEIVDLVLPGPDERASAEEDAVEVRAALASLPADDREVVWLRVCAGLTSEQVGEIVGKRPGAVRMQQLRALEAMARKLTT